EGPGITYRDPRAVEDSKVVAGTNLRRIKYAVDSQKRPPSSDSFCCLWFVHSLYPHSQASRAPPPPLSTYSVGSKRGLTAFFFQIRETESVFLSGGGPVSPG